MTQAIQRNQMILIRMLKTGFYGNDDTSDQTMPAEYMTEEN